MRILLIEDDSKTAEYLRQGLPEDVYELSVANNGQSGLLSAIEGNFDLLIIDRMLPGLDGLTLLRTLRTAKVDTPALFLTALGGINDRVLGLNAGGDDYIVKPFVLAELEARLEALDRRKWRGHKNIRLCVADLELDRISGRVRRGARDIDLTPKEYQLLLQFMLYEGQVLTRNFLLEKVWNYRFPVATRIVESHVSRLRNKIDDGFTQKLIHTHQNGYLIARNA
ncbi:response regulator transcription factor [Acidocella sp.]|uniref:response regulator n=1 Tax=Acidocella sp. TaxID=50710 RepID=UPI0026052159|nr:response regulator transcription factor [Acidocella sp.]